VVGRPDGGRAASIREGAGCFVSGAAFAAIAPELIGLVGSLREAGGRAGASSPMPPGLATGVTRSSGAAVIWLPFDFTAHLSGRERFHGLLGRFARHFEAMRTRQRTGGPRFSDVGRGRSLGRRERNGYFRAALVAIPGGMIIDRATLTA